LPVNTQQLMRQYDELVAENARLRDVLREAALQIEYLQDKFQHTGTGNSTLQKIEFALHG